MSRRLSYIEIADDFAERIAAGDYRAGDQIPSYTAIADLYAVSYHTAYRAVRVLRERGLVYGERGRGVFVARG